MNSHLEVGMYLEDMTWFLRSIPFCTNKISGTEHPTSSWYGTSSFPHMDECGFNSPQALVPHLYYSKKYKNNNNNFQMYLSKKKEITFQIWNLENSQQTVTRAQ
ncbi:hypothetical protein ACB094_01G222800 [Castanea mollissima]